MKKLFVSLFMAMILTVGAFGLSTPASASPATGHHYITNQINATFTVNCTSLENGDGMYFEYLAVYAGNTGNLDCTHFSVGNTRRVLYESLATGARYWTECGRYLTHNSHQDFGWERIGNDVALLAKEVC
jgi:hypothetical protein